MNPIVEKEQLQRSKKIHDSEAKRLIQEGGYVSPDPYLWEDVLISSVLKNPVLLKGPSGSGKTKLAQTISHYFNQPMQSINCSVDLDAEALLGFKTIINQNG